jgi:hypothetical protein
MGVQKHYKKTFTKKSCRKVFTKKSTKIQKPTFLVEVPVANRAIFFSYIFFLFPIGPKKYHVFGRFGAFVGQGSSKTQ